MVAFLNKARKHKLKVVFAGSITFAFVFAVRFYKRAVEPDPYASYSEETEPWYLDWRKALRNDTKIILLYTSWFKGRFWWTMKGQQIYNHFNTCAGPKNCIVTYDRALIQDADAVVFHGRDLEKHRSSFYSGKTLKSLRKTVPQRQIWIFFAHENPRKDSSIYIPYDGIFNWTATFDRRSDLFVPYSSYEEDDNESNRKTDYAKVKTDLVAWAASHCNIMRDRYIIELQRHINITVYGKCSKYFKKKGQACEHNKKDCKKVLSRYKFYLAFENDFCHDYVTEKYWERISQNVVPVVMGANYDEGVDIPGSFIDASKFDSIQKLAEYLLYLDKNDEEYNKYFNYKRKPREKYSSIFCRICSKLHEVIPGNQVVKLSKAYNYDKNCGYYQAKIARFEKQIEYSRYEDGYSWSRFWFKAKSFYSNSFKIS